MPGTSLLLRLADGTAAVGSAVGISFDGALSFAQVAMPGDSII